MESVTRVASHVLHIVNWPAWVCVTFQCLLTFKHIPYSFPCFVSLLKEWEMSVYNTAGKETHFYADVKYSYLNKVHLKQLKWEEDNWLSFALLLFWVLLEHKLALQEVYDVNFYISEHLFWLLLAYASTQQFICDLPSIDNMQLPPLLLLGIMWTILFRCLRRCI